MNSVLKLQLLFYVSVYSEETVRYIPEGTAVTLPCNTNGANASYWIGPNSSFHGVGLPTDIKKLPRIHVNFNYSIGQFDLLLEDFSKTDEGLYRCHTLKDNSKTYFLYLQEPPTATLVNGKTNLERLTGVEGKDLELECSVLGGQPVPEVWWLYQNEILNHSVTGSVLFTIKSVTRAMDLKVIYCMVANEALVQPIKIQLQILLTLKPSSPTFDQEPIETQIKTPLRVTCSSSGGRPSPVFQWLLRGLNVTKHAIRHTRGEITSSTLVYNVTKSFDKTNITCIIIHDSTGTMLNTTSVINVKYPPLVEVSSNITTNVTVQTITLRCDAVGNPENFGYVWTHLSFYNERIRTLTGDSNGELQLPPPYHGTQLSHFDSGLYICSVSNGLQDSRGSKTQNATTAVVIETQPIFITNDNTSVQYGQLRKTTVIRVLVHIVPKPYNVTWYYTRQKNMRNSKRKRRYQKNVLRTQKHMLTATEKFTMSEKEGTATVPGVNKYTIEAYELHLTITNITIEDFTLYTVKVGNQYGFVDMSINLRSNAVPETPTNFSILPVFLATSFMLQWIPAFNGGYRQWFCVDYRLLNVTSWNRISVQKTEDDYNRNEPQPVVFRLEGLAPSSTYEIRLLAMNVKGNSQPTYTIVNRTMDQRYQDDRSYGEILGGALGGVLAAVLIIGITTITVLNQARRLKLAKYRRSAMFGGSAKSRVTWQQNKMSDISAVPNDITITIDSKLD